MSDPPVSESVQRPVHLHAFVRLIDRIVILTAGALAILIWWVSKTPLPHPYDLLSYAVILYHICVLGVALMLLRQALKSPHSMSHYLKFDYFLPIIFTAGAAFLAFLVFTSPHKQQPSDEPTVVTVVVEHQHKAPDDSPTSWFSASPRAALIPTGMIFLGIAFAILGAVSKDPYKFSLGLSLTALGSLVSFEPGITFDLPDFVKQEYKLPGEQTSNSRLESLGWSAAFASGSAELNDCKDLYCDSEGAQLWTSLHENELQSLVLIGHADQQTFRGTSASGPADNRQLAEARAKWVKNCLEKEHYPVALTLAAGPLNLGSLPDDKRADDRRVHVLGLVTTPPTRGGETGIGTEDSAQDSAPESWTPAQCPADTSGEGDAAQNPPPTST